MNNILQMVLKGGVNAVAMFFMGLSCVGVWNEFEKGVYTNMAVYIPAVVGFVLLVLREYIKTKFPNFGEIKGDLNEQSNGETGKN